jgi:hypothetical protein
MSRSLCQCNAHRHPYCLTTSDHTHVLLLLFLLLQWWLQATAQLIWLQVTVVGDLEVAAYITSHVIMLAFLLGPAWRLHQVAPKRRHLVYTCVRLIHAAAVPLAVATSAAPQYFVVEMLLQAARWRVFAAAGWIHALLLQVGGWEASAHAHHAVRSEARITRTCGWKQGVSTALQGLK